MGRFRLDNHLQHVPGPTSIRRSQRADWIAAAPHSGSRPQPQSQSTSSACRWKSRLSLLSARRRRSVSQDLSGIEEEPPPLTPSQGVCSKVRGEGSTAFDLIDQPLIRRDHYDKPTVRAAHGIQTRIVFNKGLERFAFALQVAERLFRSLRNLITRLQPRDLIEIVAPLKSLKPSKLVK
jgi:hypothetical protein